MLQEADISPRGIRVSEYSSPTFVRVSDMKPFILWISMEVFWAACDYVSVWMIRMQAGDFCKHIPDDIEQAWLKNRGILLTAANS